VEVIRQHLKQSIQWKGMNAGINEMRRHYTNYLKGLPNIKEFRLKLVTISDVDQIDEILSEIISCYESYEFAPRKIDMDAMAYSCA
jgi:tRNA-dihydrouridine synthase